MTMQEGCDFLLARTNRLRPSKEHQSIDPQNLAAAWQIVVQMGGLPLALEQAGAYIEASQCSLSDYLHLFQTASQHLLDEHKVFSTHPLSVSRTFMLAFKRVEQHHLAAADLLTICAFLAPDAIPEAFFVEGAPSLGATFEAMAMDRLAFEETLKTVLSYSLIQRDASTHTLSIHRLVQVVLKGRLSPATRCSWSERVTRAVTRLFPFDEDIQTDYWQTCEQLLPHALVCLSYSESENVQKVLALPLMNRVATYFTKRARYAEAEPLFVRAAQMGEYIVGSQHPLVAESLNGLGCLYYEQALHTWEQTLGPEHPLVASPLINLGNLYCQQGRHKQAEPLYLRAWHIREQALGPEHPQLAYPLNNLGELYIQQGKYEQAEPLLERTLRIWEQALGPEHPQLAYPLNGLANLYREQSQYDQAELLYQRALSLRQQHLGPLHPDVAETLHDLAQVIYMKHKKKESLLLYQQVLELREHSLGSHHPQTLKTRKVLLELFEQMGDAQEATVRNDQAPEPKNVLLCACGCGREVDMSKSHGEPKRFFSNACKQRFYRNSLRQKRNAISEQ